MKEMLVDRREREKLRITDFKINANESEEAGNEMMRKKGGPKKGTSKSSGKEIEEVFVSTKVNVCSMVIRNHLHYQQHHHHRFAVMIIM